MDAGIKMKGKFLLLVLFCLVSITTAQSDVLTLERSDGSTFTMSGKLKYYKDNEFIVVLDSGGKQTLLLEQVGIIAFSQAGDFDDRLTLKKAEGGSDIFNCKIEHYSDGELTILSSSGEKKTYPMEQVQTIEFGGIEGKKTKKLQSRESSGKALTKTRSRPQKKYAKGKNGVLWQEGKNGVPKKDIVIQGIKCKGGYWVSFYYNKKFKEVVLAGNQVIQGVKCTGWPFPKHYDKSYYSVLFYRSGQLKFACLSQDQEIQGIKCAKGYVRFYKSGKLGVVNLSQDQEIQGIKCAKRVDFYESGKFESARLSQDQEIQGIKCAKGHKIYFYESGKIKYVYLSENQVIQGVKCADSYIDFHESGKLKSAYLSQGQEIQGIKMKYVKAKFYESGKIKEIIPSGWPHQIEIQGIWFCKRIEFYESEKIKISKAFLSHEEGIIQGIKCKGGDDYCVIFYKSGKLKHATLVENQIIQGIECWEGRDVEFHESGRIKKTYLVRSKKIQGIECWGDIEFYKDGKLKRAVLAKDQSIGGVSYKKGMKIYLNLNKKLEVLSEWEIKVMEEQQEEGE